ARHVLVDGFADAARGAFDRDVERSRKGPLDRRTGELAPHRDPAGSEVLFAEISERDVRIGQGRLRAAAAVAGGARIGTRARWADGDHAALVHRGDASAA